MLNEGQAVDGAPEGMRGVARVAPLSSSPSSSGDDSSARAHARVGHILNDKWRLERLLGVGGMGAVYEGLHRNGARAAVKVLHGHLAKHDDVRTRFLREGYAANRVEHASVVKVLDDDVVVGGQDAGMAYLVMELLVGESLESRSRRGLAVSEREFLMVADVVLEVLDVAHRSGVVHRDIKPDNLFITRGGAGRERVKVLDFGLARLLEGQPLTVHGVAIGTPPYMSPEQAAGRADEIDGRTDLFALAASGFRLITGRRIHEAGASVELVKTMGKLAAPRIRTVAPEVSEAFARVVDRALEFRREARYESAAAMRADVESALAVVGTGAPRTRPLGDARRDASIELSASDLEPIMSVELRDIESVKSIELSASDVEAIESINPVKASEPSTRVLEAMRLAEPAPAPARVAPTEPMPVTVTSTPAEPPAPLPQTPPPRPRSRLVRVGLAAFGLAVVCGGGAFAAGWLGEFDPPDSSTPSGYNIPSSATTHLSPSRPAPDERTKPPGRRPKH